MEFQSKDLLEFKKTRVVKSPSIPLQLHSIEFQWNFNRNEVRNISINAEYFQCDLSSKIIENSYNLLWKLSEEFLYVFISGPVFGRPKAHRWVLEAGAVREVGRRTYGMIRIVGDYHVVHKVTMR